MQSFRNFSRKPSRSTANARQPTELRSAEPMTSEFSIRISSFNTPTALVKPFARSELLHTSSANLSV